MSDGDLETFEDVAVKVCKENGWEKTGFHHPDELHEIWNEARDEEVIGDIGDENEITRPYDKHDRVLDYLERCDSFEKYHIRCCNRYGKEDGLKRAFELKSVELINDINRIGGFTL